MCYCLRFTAVITINTAEIIPAKVPELQPPPPLELPDVSGVDGESSVIETPDIVMVNCFVVDRVPYTALTVNLEVPAAVGVPEIVPESLRLSPAGSVTKLRRKHCTLESPSMTRLLSRKEDSLSLS